MVFGGTFFDVYVQQTHAVVHTLRLDDLAKSFRSTRLPGPILYALPAAQLHDRAWRLLLLLLLLTQSLLLCLARPSHLLPTPQLHDGVRGGLRAKMYVLPVECAALF